MSHRDVLRQFKLSDNHPWDRSHQKCQDYMPMVGHIAETGHVLATDFRAGNVTPSTIVVQRKLIDEQQTLDLECEESQDTAQQGD